MPGASIFDEALACMGQRIASILTKPAHKDKHYIASLHNEVLTAAWIIGLLESSGSSTYVPEPVRVAFRSFSDIRNPETYAAPKESLLLQAGCEASAKPKFNFNLTEWWKLSEDERLSKPFDIGEELVAGLLRVLEIRLAGAELRARTIKNFKEASQQRQDIEKHIEFLESILDNDSKYCSNNADILDNLKLGSLQK